MLASTVQFSTYDQTPVTRPRRPHNPAGRGGTRNRPALPEATVARSLRTQQRAYEPATRSPLAFPAHPKTGRTSSDYQAPAELVSVPPSSTAPDTSSHPVMGDRHGPSTALDHQTASGGQCSLERR
jgi:hypothetical protein